MRAAQLLRLLVEHALEPEVVLLAAPALASVLGAHRDITLAALDKADGLAALGSAVAAQAQAAVPARVPTAPQSALAGSALSQRTQRRQHKTRSPLTAWCQTPQSALQAARMTSVLY